MNSLRVFEMNPNSYGTIVGIVTVVFFLLIISIYTVGFERTKFMRNIIIFEILTFFYLVSFLFLVNAKSVEAVFNLTRIYYTSLAIHTLATINIICANAEKTKKFVRIYSFVGTIIFIALLYSSDKLLVTREVASYSFNIAERGPFLYLGALQNLLLASYVLYQLLSGVKRNDPLIKRNWQFHIAYIIHAGGIFVMFRLVEFKVITKPPIYISTLVFNIFLMLYLIMHIKQEVKLKETLNEDYIYDGLTKVHTREYIVEMLTAIIERQSDKSFLVMIDIDKFKSINDTYGHVTGDSVLRGFGQVLNAIKHKGIYPGRIGGDEFIIIFEGYSKKEIHYRLKNVISGYQKALLSSINNKNTLSSGISVGMSEINKDEHMEMILEKADIAMYEAKRNGRNLIKSFSEIQ